MLNNCRDDDIVRVLSANVGRVCTVFTKSGGASGCGFTGLLSTVNPEYIKLTTELPVAPVNPLGENFNGGNRRSCGNQLGTSCIIPVNAISCFATNQV